MYHANKRQSAEHYKRTVEIRIKNTYARSEAHFWERVEKTETCWNWTKAKKKEGYGKLSWRGKLNSAHRVSWLLANGEIPKGMWVLHHCDNPSCVRPDHLYLGDHEDNTRDAIIRKRFATKERHPFFGKIGERSAKHKYSDEIIRQIRAAYIPSKFGYCKIAKKFNVSKTVVAGILKGTRWGHVV